MPVFEEYSDSFKPEPDDRLGSPGFESCMLHSATLKTD